MTAVALSLLQPRLNWIRKHRLVVAELPATGMIQQIMHNERKQAPFVVSYYINL